MSVGLLVFSKDRAMQLDCFLRTLNECCEGDITTYVLFKASDDVNERHYNQLADEYKEVVFITERDLIQQTRNILSWHDYIIYCVDDCIFTNKFCVDDIVWALEETPDAIGFSLRVGTNTKYCYMQDEMQPELDYDVFGGGIIKYDWRDYPANVDFGYPLEISSSCYRTKDVARMLYPELKTVWDIEVNMTKFRSQFERTHPYLLCYETSVAFCNPINKFRKNPGIRSGEDDSYSIDELVKKYEAGYRIDMSTFHGLETDSVHQEIGFNFNKV